MQNREKQFEIVYDTHHQMVYNICYSYLRFSSDVEDIMQDSFMDFYKANKVFATPEQEKYYLIRIVINNCKTYLKKKKMVILNSEAIERMKSKEHVDDISIFDMVSILESKYKEVIILKYVENMSYKEISSILGTSEANVRKRVERAIKTLKEKWEE